MDRILEIIAKLTIQGLFAKTVYIMRIIKVRDFSRQDHLSVTHVMIRLFKYQEL